MIESNTSEAPAETAQAAIKNGASGGSNPPGWERNTLEKLAMAVVEEQRAARELLDAKHAKRQADERKRLQDFVDRFKAKASKARQAQSRVKMLERMKPVTALVTPGPDVTRATPTLPVARA